jgi:hypothetical protein
LIFAIARLNIAEKTKAENERKITINGCALAINTCVICECGRDEMKVQKLF